MLRIPRQPISREKRRLRIGMVLSAAVLMLSNADSSAAESAPSPLRGKSIVIEWPETRMQRRETDPAAADGGFHEISAQMAVKVYFGPEGRAVARLTPTVRGQSANIDRTVGEGVSSTKWVIAFAGASLTLIQPTYGARALRRVDVRFDAGFSTCSAQIAYAKRSGEAIWRAWSPIAHTWILIQSNTPGPANCTVKSGDFSSE